jgi:hypothetical protein
VERKALSSAAANYPYLQGLWAIPMGFLIMLAGLSNLEHGPAKPVILAIFGGGLLLTLMASRRISRHYRDNYGTVTPTRSSRVRNAVALAAWIAVLFVGANKNLWWSPDSRFCVYASAFAAATMVYYAILVGLRVHHVAIWAAVFVAGLLPIWGGLGADRDAVAMFPLGAAFIASGLLDQRRLARDLGTASTLNLENSNVGA